MAKIVALMCAENIGRCFMKSLKAQGMEVRLLFSPEVETRTFGVELFDDIVTFSDAQQFYEAMHTTALDFMFSIINPRIVPAHILDLPRYGSFNFHDSLLPRHRGVNAVGWAMWEGDEEYGYTWHKMVGDVDAGPILHQSRLPLDHNSTTHKQSMRVFVKAMCEFPKVLEKASLYAQGTLPLSPQPLAKSNIHRQRDKPSLSSRIIDPAKMTRMEILRRQRALDFGPLIPRLGHLYIWNKQELIPCQVSEIPTKKTRALVCSDGGTVFITCKNQPRSEHERAESAMM